MDIYPKKQLKLSDFKEYRFIIDDVHNKVTNGYIWLFYFDKNNQIDLINQINNINNNSIKNREDVESIAHKSIGYISYKIKTGQIGLFFIKEDYQNFGLGKQILLNIINELNIDDKQIWTVSFKDHLFWSNVFEQSFEFVQSFEFITRSYNAVTGSGYLLNLEKFNNYKKEYNL